MSLMSCNFNQKKEQGNSLKGWILSNQHSLMLAADTIVQSYNNANKADSNWTSSTIAITRYGSDTWAHLRIKFKTQLDASLLNLPFIRIQIKKRKMMLAAQFRMS